MMSLFMMNVSFLSLLKKNDQDKRGHGVNPAGYKGGTKKRFQSEEAIRGTQNLAVRDQNRRQEYA